MLCCTIYYVCNSVFTDSNVLLSYWLLTYETKKMFEFKFEPSLVCEYYLYLYNCAWEPGRVVTSYNLFRSGDIELLH